jgi:hypothetical protein
MPNPQPWHDPQTEPEPIRRGEGRQRLRPVGDHRKQGDQSENNDLGRDDDAGDSQSGAVDETD